MLRCLLCVRGFSLLRGFLLCWLSLSLHAHEGSLVAFYIFSCGDFEFTEEFFYYFVWQLNGSHEENRRRLLTQPMSLILVRKLVLSLGFRGSHPVIWTVLRGLVGFHVMLRGCLRARLFLIVMMTTWLSTRNFFDAGLRFPPHRLVIGVLKRFNLKFHQLNPSIFVKLSIYVWGVQVARC